MKVHDSEPQTPYTRLRRRLDGVDERLAQLDVLTGDVAAVGHTLGDLSARVEALAAATSRRPTTGLGEAPDSGDGLDELDGPAVEAAEGREGQPDWLTVTDPESAAVWLADAFTFADDILARFPDTRLAVCWPLHPIAVTEMVALRLQYVTAYSSPDAGAVSELLARWLPGTVRRLRAVTGNCGNRGGHVEGKRAYQVPHLDPGRVALWWTETRGADPTAVQAFAMSPLAGER